MASFVYNIAAGKVVAYYDRVKSGDPSTARLVVTPLEATGLEAKAALIDSDTVAEVVDGATNKQATMGEKVLAAADLAAIPAPDDGNDRNARALPNILWTAPAGNQVGAFLVSYRPDAGSPSDATDIPLCQFDRTLTPDGNNYQLNAADFIWAQSA